MTITEDGPVRDAEAPARTARLDQLRAALMARGCSAWVVTLSPDDRAERIRDYGLEG